MTICIKAYKSKWEENEKQKNMKIILSDFNVNKKNLASSYLRSSIKKSIYLTTNQNQ